MNEDPERGSDYGAPPPLNPALTQFTKMAENMGAILGTMAQIVYMLDQENQELRHRLEGLE